MWTVLRSRACSSLNPQPLLQPWKLGFSSLSTIVDASISNCTLNLQEIEKILTDVKADDVKIIPVPKHNDWADFMVLATGRSTWHVKNIAQALIYKAKQKQQGVERMTLPSVQGKMRASGSSLTLALLSNNKLKCLESTTTLPLLLDPLYPLSSVGMLQYNNPISWATYKFTPSIA